MRLVNGNRLAVTVFIMTTGKAMPMPIGITSKGITTATLRTRLMTDKF
jgi:hypothetical protein